MKGLTQRQERALWFIAHHIEQFQRPPLAREFVHEFGFSALRSATNYFDALERKGFISRIDGKILVKKFPDGTPVELKFVERKGDQ
jgi:SOS-response transcriptional repressor LexA